MIAVDTSALLAIVLGESDGERCEDVLRSQSRVLISAATLAEALIVAGRRKVLGAMMILIDELGFDIIDVTPLSARRAAAAYER